MTATFHFEYFDRRPDDPPNSDLIVFVHGFIGDLAATWDQFPALLSSDPDLPALDILLCGYRSRFLRWDPDIPRTGKRVISELDVQAATDTRIFLVGHSMGGLVILSGLAEACRDGYAQQKPTANIAWVTLFASPTMGSEAAGSFKYLIGLLRLFPTRILAWAVSTRQLRQLARGTFVDELLREVMQRLYCTDIAPGDMNTKRYINIRVVIGDDDRVVTESSARGLFHRLPPRYVTGTHSTMKEPTHHRDSRYLALTSDITECLRAEFSTLCAQCLAGDHQAQSRFTRQWERAMRSRLDKVFRDDANTAERRQSLRALTWRLGAADASLTPGRALDAAMVELTYPHEGRPA